MKNFYEVILELRPGAEFSATDSKITAWHDANQAEPTEAEIQAKLAELQNAEPMRLLRQQRNQKLSETDWWCCSDRTATPEQLAYRQALRDLPETQTPALDEDGQLTGVTWPTKPE